MTKKYNKKKSAIIIRDMPDQLRRGLKAKAALEGKSMNCVIIELITQYVEKEE